HFIEIGVDETDRVWVVIHSGSRGLGHGIAGSWMAIAADSPKPKEGHYALDITSDKGCEYINDLNWCLDFALENRRRMMEKVSEAIRSFCEGKFLWDQLINRNHNHAEPKGGLWIHRKGATHAEKGMMGVIPGNMRDGSFIIEGLGNEDSLCSCSHGAGRVLGRNQAKKKYTVADLVEQTKGIECPKDIERLDEIPAAYKSIEKVMENQSDLVNVLHTLHQVINVKG
ncbi:RtcB family protein, partial [bacterium]|nr:RtcB family protein [bacterium]